MRWVFALALACASCAPLSRRVAAPLWSADLPAPRLAADMSRVDTIARGVLHRVFVVNRGPWTVHVLDVDRRACWSPVAVKGTEGAVGREKSSELVRRLAATLPPDGERPGSAGGVNADFFLFTPPGVPVNLHVEKGRVVSGPAERPVFAVDSAGRPWIGVLRVEGSVSSGAATISIAAWNRPARTAVAYFDRGHGSAVDSASGSVRVALANPGGGSVLSIDSSGASTVIPMAGSVLVVGRDAPGELRSSLLVLARSGRLLAIDVRLVPFHPREAIGGFPVLLRDSAEVAGLDSAGSASFAPVRHPRTIVGVAAGGRRLLFIAVDGRQTGYSAGMTLRESAQLARDLGATQAINLDGGGSTTMVVARRDGAGFRYDVVNRPSDPTGERAVGNALAVVSRCEIQR